MHTICRIATTSDEFRPHETPMDWLWVLSKAPAAVGVLKDLVLAGVAISGAVVGWKALTKWREETVGKRRLELAEEVLTSFYQVQAVIRSVRAPFIDAREQVAEEGVPDDVVAHPAYGVRRRLRDSFDKIIDLRTKRHRFAAVFGKEATAPWDEIEAVLREIDDACGALLDLGGEHVPANDPNASFYIEQRQIAFLSPRSDPITPRVERAVHNIEARCQPIIRASVRS